MCALPPQIPQKGALKTSLLGTFGPNMCPKSRKRRCSNTYTKHTPPKCSKTSQKLSEMGQMSLGISSPKPICSVLGARPTQNTNFQLQKLPNFTPFYLRFKAFLQPLTMALAQKTTAFLHFFWMLFCISLLPATVAQYCGRRRWHAAWRLRSIQIWASFDE